MNVSFNGLRKNATSSMNKLGDEIKELLEKSKQGIFFEIEDLEELVESFNETASYVDMFNCLFDDNVKDDMDDLSDDIEIQNIDIEDFKEEEL